jgi:mRNA interferase MazF
MGKPVAGEVVVLPFPHTDLRTGKRRPALVVADLPGEDLIFCQITSRVRPDPYGIALSNATTAPPSARNWMKPPRQDNP